MMPQMSLIKEKGNMRFNGITSGEILSLLQTRHSKDVFVPECKNGETWGARDLLKIDAWALLRTYSPLTMVGYEIKTSRQDFEQDQKWTGYLDLCHIFYFVCPAGLIRAEDLPQRVGIIWVSKSGKLHTKRKPERVEPDAQKLNRLLVYVLMARSSINTGSIRVTNSKGDILEDSSYGEKENLQLKKEIVERANDRKELAYFVKSHVRGMIEHSQKTDRELINREQNIKRFEDKLALLGITWDSENNNWQDTMQIDNEINLLKNCIDPWTLSGMKQTGKLMIETAEKIDKLRGRISNGV